jgi:hypothetical protein
VAETTESAESILMAVDKETSGHWNKSRTIVPEEGGATLPDGTTGVARLSNYKVGRSEKGDPYIRFVWTVVTPEEFEGFKLNRTIYLADGQYSSAEENQDKVSAVLQHCRCDIAAVPFTKIATCLKDACKRKAAVRYEMWQGEGSKKPSMQIRSPASEEYPDVEEGDAAPADDAPPPRATRTRGSSTATTKSPPKNGKAVPPPSEAPDFDDIPVDDEGDGGLPDFGDDTTQEPEPYVPKKGDVGKIQTKQGPKEVKILSVDLKNEKFDAQFLETKSVVKGVAFKFMLLEE